MLYFSHINTMASIYIHIPFCKQACNYCDFHFSTNLKYVDSMIAAMLLELNQKQDYLDSQNIQSVYFGGGTPSIIDAKHIDQLLSALHKQFHIEAQAEITLEANPDDLTLEKLNAIKAIGFNRLSIGLQSFNDAELNWMHRAHTAKESLQCLDLAKQAGFDNISMDLIYGSPLSNEQSWEAQLKIVETLPVQHLSCYALTVEDKTALGHAVKNKILPDVDDGQQALQFKLLQDWAKNSGYQHYEISNLGLPNYHSKHNSAYWANAAYLGIGPSAHSYNGKSRQWNISNNAIYMKLIKEGGGYYENEILNEKDQYNELILTQLRTSKGLNKKLIQSAFSASIQQHFENELQKQIFLKNTIEENGTIRIPYEKWFQADGIASELFFVNGD